MDSAVTLVLLALLTAFVGDVGASCREVANDEMLEYFCEGGHPTDLTTIPESTEKLRITGMPLRRITADTFSRFGGNLWVLGCSHCEITDIDANAFRHLVNLQQLSLDSNHLNTVRASWFEGLDYLTYLDLNYNDIRDIEDSVYDNLPGLVDLRISGNRLRCLNVGGMSHLRELKRIFLKENPDFACPHAVSELLENRGVAFERDPEWSKIPADTIDVRVPPNYEEEYRDKGSVPAHRERLHPDRRLRPEQPELPPEQLPSEQSPPEQPSPEQPHYIPPVPAGDRMFHPDYHAHPHYGSRRRPTTTLRPTTSKYREKMHPPRVEQIVEGTKTAHVPSESHYQTMSYPYTTMETPRSPPVEWRPFPEDIRLRAGSDGHILTYPSYVPTRATIIYPPYPTSEISRSPSVESRPPPEEIGLRAGIDEPPLTDRTYPSYVPTRETPYSSYATSERSRIVATESKPFAENETMEESDKPSHAEDTVTYPLYVTSSDHQKGSSRGSIQMIERPSSNDNNEFMVTPGVLSIDVSMEHLDDLSQVQNGEHYGEQSHRPTGQSSWPTDAPARHGTSHVERISYDPPKAVIDDRWSSDTDDFFATDYSEYTEVGDSRATTQASTDRAKDTHYVRPLPPSHPELVQPISIDDFSQGPYYEPTMTVRPPMQSYREDNDETTSADFLLESSTTDKSLPDCPDKSSAPKNRPISMIVMAIVVTVLGHVVVGF